MLERQRTIIHVMPGCFEGKQLVINNCVKSVPTARFLIHLTLTLNNETREQEPFSYRNMR